MFRWDLLIKLFTPYYNHLGLGVDVQLKDIYKDPAWQGINAVKNRRVYQPPLMSSWSPDFALLSLYYATKAYPELFKDINFDEFYKEFTKKVFGISLEPYYGG
jgi:iron complex transport system substrate-binding protein